MHLLEFRVLHRLLQFRSINLLRAHQLHGGAHGPSRMNQMIYQWPLVVKPQQRLQCNHYVQTHAVQRVLVLLARLRILLQLVNA